MPNLPLPVLDQARIAHPCPEPWNAMAGDEQRRFCASCEKHVHNLSALTRAEAATLLEGGGKLCIKMTLDSKGKLKTRDDPPTRRGWIGKIAAMCAAALGVTMSGCEGEQELWGNYCDPNDQTYKYTGAEPLMLTPAKLKGMTFICRDVRRDSADALLETWTLTFRDDGTAEWDRHGHRATGLVSVADNGAIEAHFDANLVITAAIDWNTRDLLWDDKVYVPVSK